MSRIPETISKTKHKESPQILSNYVLQKPDTGSPQDSFKLLEKQNTRDHHDAFKLFQKQNKRGHRDSFKLHTSKSKVVPEILSNYF